ncbi:MAG: hypothetical protein DWH91_00270 [Planctomycetota bacterium]|nr:MAG: hypothetical protein DWH91_00270 [Planctomycetota bacterium]
MKMTTEQSTGHRTTTAIIVTALLVFAAPLMTLGLRYLRLDNNVESWLPANDSEATIFNWYRSHFDEEERILVTWRGSTLDDPRFDALRTRLLGQVDADGMRRGGVPYISTVVTGREMLQRMVGYGVPQDEAISRMTGTLIGTGRVKLRLTDAGREERAFALQQLKEKAHHQLGIDVVAIATSSQTLNAPPADTLDETSDSATVETSPAEVVLEPLVIPAFDLELTWKGYSPVDARIEDLCTIARKLTGVATAADQKGRPLVDDCFVIPGSPVAMTVTLSEAGQADASATLVALRHAALQVGIKADDLILGGSSVATTELNRSVLRAVWDPSAPLWQFHRRSVMLLSGLVGMILAFLSLKSIRLGLLVLGVSYYAAFVSTALVPLTGGVMTMVMIVLPTFVMVVALSGAIHVANYVGHETHLNPVGAVNRAVKAARLPCFNSVFTTVLGLLSLMSSSLIPVRAFGLYSSIGASLTLVMVLVVLPALLKLFPTQGQQQQENDQHRWTVFTQFIIRWHRPVLTVSVILCLIACAGLYRFRTETRVIRNFADDSRLIHDYKYIEEQLTGISSVETIIRFNAESQKSLKFLERMELVREIADGIRAHKEVSGAVCLPYFQPSFSEPGPDSSGRERLVYNRRSSETEKRVKDPATSDAGSLVAVASIAVDLHQPGDQGLNSAGDELWRITAQVPALADVDYNALTAELDGIVQQVTALHPGTNHFVTGTVPLFMRTQEALLFSLLWSFLYAFLTIGAVMILAQRSFVAGILSMVPNVLPIGAVFGLVSWGHVRIDIGTMVTASVALGLAVDSSLHLLTWFHRGIEDGMKRDDAIVGSLAHCGPAMLQTNLGIALAMIVLYPSDLVMISRFGWLMSALTFAAYFGNAVILPAMLKGPMGSAIEMRALKSRARLLAEAATQTPAEASEDAASHPVVVEVATSDSDAATVTPFDLPTIVTANTGEDASDTDETSILESLPIEQARKAKRHAG